MKKILPLISLIALVAVAASAAGVVRGKEAPVLESVAADSSQLARFCAQYWGMMSEDGSVCRFEQTFHFNRTHVGSSLLATSLPVIAGDTLSIQATSSALPVVGERAYDSRSFVSETEGYLSFRSAENPGLFSVRKVGLRRCFSSSGNSVAPVVCPQQ